MRYPVIITPDREGGGYTAECPAIPGCISEGDTIEEALDNIRDAIEGCLAVLREVGEPVPEPTEAIITSVHVAA